MEFYDSDKLIFTTVKGYEEWTRNEQWWTCSDESKPKETDLQMNMFIEGLIGKYGPEIWGQSLWVMRNDGLLDK